MQTLQPETNDRPRRGSGTGDVFAKARDWEMRPTVDALREHNLLPWFRRLEGPAGPVVRMEGRDRIMLGSNNYLGLTGDERVKRAAQEATARYGTGVTGSRLLNGTLALHVEFEEELADWMGTEAALIYATGYLANLGAIATLCGPDDVIVCDSFNHASILDAITMSRARIRPFRHGRLDKLERALRRGVDGDGGMLVVTDSVFSMEGDVAELREVVQLCETYGARLLVDEAHGVGVFGPTGAGVSEEHAVGDRVDLRMGTFSKSLASCGGFIAGPSDVIEHLRLQSRSFMFTASGTPGAVAAAREALRVIRSDEGLELLARVRENARSWAQGLEHLGFRVAERGVDASGRPLGSPIVPVLIGDDGRCGLLWRELYEAGVYVNQAAYPAVPRGGALLRTSVMATHAREHLDRALEIFERCGRRIPEDVDLAMAMKMVLGDQVPA